MANDSAIGDIEPSINQLGGQTTIPDFNEDVRCYLSDASIEDGDCHATPSQEKHGKATSWIPPCSPSLCPTVGQVFSTLDEAVVFYRNYAKISGFMMRLATIKRRRTGGIRIRYCLCSKEGHSRLKMDVNSNISKRVRLVTRVGCKARIVFKLTNKGKYEVFKFIDAHNHPLASPSSIPFLKSSRNLTIGQKTYMVANSRMNVGATKSFRLWKEKVGSYQMVGASIDDFKNFYRDLREFIKDKDAQMFIENLYKKRDVSKSFFFDYDVDEIGSLTRVFWADPLSRKNYALFGDMVSYDPTYRTNTYSMVFTPFTGLDHHKKCITFAAAFIAKEDVDSFEWVFRTFLKAMDNQQPPSIITDQDPAIKTAIERVFDKSSHRFCMWHITTKFPEKLPPTLRTNSTFLKKINSCVWSRDLEPSEFESTWLSIMEEYSLQGYPWFQRLFSMREMWIPSYFRDTRLGGLLRTTSRSESENKFFNNFVNRHLTLVEFWMRFESAMDAQRYKQSRLNSDSRNSLPLLKTPLPLEKYGSQVYTHTLFYEFQEEICAACYSCGVSEMKRQGDIETLIITGFPPTKRYEVMYNLTTQEIACSCKMFQQFGILCRHSLFVMKLKGIQTLPSCYVLNRWTKEATKKPMFDMDGNLLEDCAKMDESRKKTTYG